MKKLFCKQNLIVGGALLGVLLCIVFALVFGKTPAVEPGKKANVLIYCLAAVLLSVVMFNGITKTIDKKTKIYFIILFCLFAFWLGIKIFDKVSAFNDDNDYTWYFLYIPLLFIPSMWFITNNQIYINNKTYKKTMAIISLLISLLLFLLVLTNDYHQLVFIFPDGVSGTHVGDYKYNIGYFIIYAFIFIEILTTIVLFYTFSVKKTTIKQKILPSIVILLVLIYSVVYVVADIPVPYLSDMTLVYTILGTLLVYVSLKCGLIKNSGAYFEFFETCNVPLAIVNDNLGQANQPSIKSQFKHQNQAQNQTQSQNQAQSQSQAKNQNQVVSELKSAIEYQNLMYAEQKNNPNMILKKQKLSTGTLLVLEDVGKLKTLQASLKQEIEKLEYSNKILENNKQILQKEKQIEQHTLLLSKIEQQIKTKRAVLEQLLGELPTEITKQNKNQTKATLNQIKLVVGYLKRKTSLILLAEQKKEISKDELKLMFNESFNDLKWLNINAGIGLSEKPIPVDVANKFYDIYNELITKIGSENLDIWLTIKKRKVWQFEITFDGVKIEKPALNLPKEYGVECSVQYEDDSTLVCFKGADL